MSKVFYILIILLNFENSFSISFQEAISNIETHDGAKSIELKSMTLLFEGEMKGSWGDPILKVAAKNYPQNSLKDNKTPMSGIEFGLSQKIALTNKYGNIRNAYISLSRSKNFEFEERKRELINALWRILINERRIEQELKILKENLDWTKKNLKVSKKFYANGRMSQQSLLDIEIRKTEIEVEISNKKYELEELRDNLSYILGTNKEIDKTTIPWRVLNKRNSNSKLNDVKELALKSNILAKDYMVTASKLNYVPDLTFSVGYTKRSDIDGMGDFVSASISLPLPFSGEKYSSSDKSFYERREAVRKLSDYTKYRESEKMKLIHESLKISNELKILKEKTINFAENSRKVTFKSYGLGESTYFELLQSELQLQKLLLRRSMLEAKLATVQITYKFLIGDKLHE